MKKMLFFTIMLITIADTAAMEKDTSPEKNDIFQSAVAVLKGFFRPQCVENLSELSVVPTIKPTTPTQPRSSSSMSQYTTQQSTDSKQEIVQHKTEKVITNKEENDDVSPYQTAPIIKTYRVVNNTPQLLAAVAQTASGTTIVEEYVFAPRKTLNIGVSAEETLPLKLILYNRALEKEGEQFDPKSAPVFVIGIIDLSNMALSLQYNENGVLELVNIK